MSAIGSTNSDSAGAHSEETATAGASQQEGDNEESTKKEKAVKVPSSHLFASLLTSHNAYSRSFYHYHTGDPKPSLSNLRDDEAADW